MLRGDTVELSPRAAVLGDRAAALEVDPGEGTIPIDLTEAEATEPEAAEPAPERVAPHIPRFAAVPESLQWPAGPYRQAPAEFGGEWWLTNPFTGAEPWITQTGAADVAKVPAAEVPEAPAAFLELFGPPPQLDPTISRLHRSTEMAQWLIDLENFQGTGVPEGFSQEQVDRAADLFESWGLGRPVFYEGAYGWKARFPDSSIPEFEAAPFTAIESPHLVVAKYQIKMTQQGSTPLERHPFVPPQVFGDAPMDA